MSLSRKFWVLDLDEKIILIEVSILLIIVRFCLRLVPFQILYRTIERFSSLARTSKQGDSAYEKKIVRAVNRSGRFFLGNKICLPQALVTYLLIKRHGQDPQLKIGVRKSDNGMLQAHAWVENEGQVVIGGSGIDLDRYVKLHDLNKAFF